ncbi:MAG: MoaD/ThiS family protein [Chthoniobacterales bacterium]
METIKIKVEFYSVLRDQVTKVPEVTVEIPSGQTLQNLLDKLFLEFPSLKDWDKQLLLAADLDYIEREHVLREGEVISIMPPVQGG